MSTDPMLRLYRDDFWISPYVFTAFVALREKGLPFDVEAVPLQEGAQHRATYREKAIIGRVPALVHGDFWLTESSAMVEYLEEAFPAPRYPRLLPKGVQERARARQILAWIRSDLMALRDERPTWSMFYTPATAPVTPALQAAIDRLLFAAERLIPEGSSALFGEWSIADADLAFVLHRLILNGIEVPEKVRAFATGQWSRPSVREFVEQPRKPYIPY